MQATKVIGRDNDANINAILQYGTNPILNTRVYDVMLFDVLIRQYSYNFIAENILNYVDKEGYRYTMIDEIVGHYKIASAI